ncbi:unnamed protein product, partial [Ectocarpus sp. 8 AP-2014]
MAHLQAGGGVPVYQMAGAGIDGGQTNARANGVASGGGGGGGGGGGNGGNGRVSPLSPSVASPQPGAPHPQSFQVHYAITPQGIVPMVPVVPNGAGGFTNPALYPGVGAMYDDGRAAGMGAMPGVSAVMDAGAGGGVEKGRLSPALAAPMQQHPRFSGSPTHPPPHVHHPGGLQQQQQPMHAPAWSVGGGAHDVGGAPHMGYLDAGGGGYADGSGYRGGGGGPGGPGQDFIRGARTAR